MKFKYNLLILEKEDFSKPAIALLQKKFNVRKLPKNNLLQNKYIQSSHIIFIRLKYNINKIFLDKAVNLKFLVSPTTGLNHLDLNELKKRKIKVISLNKEKKFLKKINSTPELTWALALNLVRKINSAYDDVIKNNWNREKFKGIDLHDKYCGIIGYGRIGRVIRKYAKAFDMRVMIYDPYKKLNNTKESSSLSQIFKKSFLIFVTANSNDKNNNLIDKKYFKLTSSSFFINTSRGEIVNYIDMINFVNEKNLLGVGLDVFPNEQNRNYMKQLLKKIKKIKNFREKFIITPHLGGATKSSMQMTEYFLSKKLIDYVKN